MNCLDIPALGFSGDEALHRPTTEDPDESDAAGGSSGEDYEDSDDGPDDDPDDDADDDDPDDADDDPDDDPDAPSPKKRPAKAKKPKKKKPARQPLAFPTEGKVEEAVAAYASIRVDDLPKRRVSTKLAALESIEETIAVLFKVRDAEPTRLPGVPDRVTQRFGRLQWARTPGAALVVVAPLFTTKLCIEHVRALTELLDWEPTIGELIVVTAKPRTPPAAKQLKLLRTRVTSFTVVELMRPVILHSHHDPHRRLAKTEVVPWLKQYSITKPFQQLPLLLTTDIVTRFYGWAAGDIIEIMRTYGKGMEPTPYYRIVCEPPRNSLLRRPR